MPNFKKLNDLDIAPAQIIGGMRMKQHDAHRMATGTKKETSPPANEDRDTEDKTQNEFSEEDERLRILALKEKQAQDMYAHTASRRPNVSKNAGNNVKQGFIHPTQPRSMNH